MEMLQSAGPARPLVVAIAVALAASFGIPAGASRAADVASGAEDRRAVQFEAAVKDGLPWEFWPVEPVVWGKPGETLRALYRARNISDRPATGKAIHLETPQGVADEHLEIIQCFCFFQQTLGPGQEKEFPLVFRFRWDTPETVKTLTVRYEFYPIKSFPVAQLSPEVQQLAALDHGELEIRLEGGRTLIAHFEQLRVAISQISIQRASSPQAGAWMTFAPSMRRVDLDHVPGPRHAVILRERAPRGEYRVIRVGLVEAEGVWENGNMLRFTTPSNPLAVSFLITPRKRAVLTLEPVVSDVKRPGHGEHELPLQNVSVELVDAGGGASGDGRTP